MVSKKTRVVIVGGGFGGVKAALELAGKPGFSVQLISNNTHFEYHGALYRSAVGHSPKEVIIPLKEIFEGKDNIELVLDEIGYINPEKKLVIGMDGDSYAYDKVIFALGNTVNYFGIEGLEDHTETMHDISSTLKLRKKLIDIFSQPHRSAIRIAVVGGGASGVELVSEIEQFAKLIAKTHRLTPPKMHLLMVEASDRLLPNLLPKASAVMSKRLIKLGVEIYLNMAVKSCSPGQLCLQAGELNADLIIWTAGSKPSSFFAANPDVFTLGRGARVTVNANLQLPHNKDIYVIGDNADTKYSGMAQTAIHDAKFVASNLIRQKQNKKSRNYRAMKPLYVVTAGGKWALVQKGNSVISGLRGWRIRRKADMWIFENFEPYKKAIATWRAGNKMSRL